MVLVPTSGQWKCSFHVLLCYFFIFFNLGKVLLRVFFFKYIFLQTEIWLSLWNVEFTNFFSAEILKHWNFIFEKFVIYFVTTVFLRLQYVRIVLKFSKILWKIKVDNFFFNTLRFNYSTNFNTTRILIQNELS